MSRYFPRKFIGIILGLLLVALAMSPPISDLLLLPQTARLVVGEQMAVKLTWPARILDNLVFSVGDSFSPAESAVVVDRGEDGYQLRALKPGQVDITVKLLGHIPLKSIQVESLPTRKLVAGGHSIGIMLQSEGIMVVGYAPIKGLMGREVYPARTQGIKTGDLIMKVNDRPVYTEAALAEIIDNCGQSGTHPGLLIKRDGSEETISVTPVFCAETGRFRIGLYVRDGVAGVGTLTCWDPDTHSFAALGHAIVDSDTKKTVNIREGRIVGASIQAVEPGYPGQPGEKIGVFDQHASIKGEIESNTLFGVFGRTEEACANELYPQLLPVSYAHQIKKGPAQIVTVVEGNRLEKFEVVIEKVYSFRHNGKGMVIRVTDPRLLSISGGIVQGMSGSPIIQDNRLAGAVTHVFLNDPQRGYGIFMDNMLEQMNLLTDQSFSRQIAQ
ncbi:MAG: SpoIVB peptidase [Syntrophomonadaceae bacterium]|nr:SpoIVB peptidase [Syntrophomonadaceae bacterium]